MFDGLERIAGQNLPLAGATDQPHAGACLAVALDQLLDGARDLDEIADEDRADEGDVDLAVGVELPVAPVVQHLGDEGERHQAVRDGPAEGAGFRVFGIDMDRVEVSRCLGIGVDHVLRDRAGEHGQGLADDDGLMIGAERVCDGVHRSFPQIEVMRPDETSVPSGPRASKVETT